VRTTCRDRQRPARLIELDVSTDDAPDVKAIAGLIASADRGDAASAESLFTTLYHELHRVARRQLRAGSAGATLGATTLLHECYLDMAGRAAAFPDQHRFIAYAAHAMRGLIVDYVRERRALKRGGEFHLTALDTLVAESIPIVDDTVRLGEALDRLLVTDAALAELVELKFFCGFSFAEIAAMRGVSERTVQRDWQKARLLLHSELRTE
jgi:RNA polymerase sigma factor (TIGR02999 family)